MMRSKHKPGKTPLRGLSVDWLAGQCGCSVDMLWALSRDSKQMYNPERGQLKPNGGTRMIDPIKREYRSLLRRTGKALHRKIGVHDSWHGGTPGRSSFTSARRHQGCRFLITRDVTNCFGSVNPSMLMKAFRRLGASSEFARFLSDLMTVRGRIPQGGPLSNLALNLFFLRQDGHLHRFAQTKGGNYGRLTDDFAVSMATREKALKTGSELDRAIEGRGLKVNERKRDKRGLIAGDRGKELHSLKISSKRRISPKHDHKQKAVTAAEKYARKCACATPNDVARLSGLRKEVTGWMYYMQQADRSPARHLAHMVMVADSKVLRMLRGRGLATRNKWWTEAEVRRLLAECRRRETAASVG